MSRKWHSYRVTFLEPGKQAETWGKPWRRGEWKEKGKELTVQYGTHYMIFVGALIRYTYTLSPNGMIEYEQTTFRRARGNRICVVEIE